MRLVTYDPGDGRARPGLVVGEDAATRVLDLEVGLGVNLRCGCLRGLVQEIPLETLLPRLAEIEGDALAPGAPALAPRPLDAVTLRAPVTRPPKVTAVGLNYRDHALEQGKEPPTAPMLFAKARTSVAGPSEPVRFSRAQDRVDWEVELCLVVGKPGFRVPRERAREHLLGYTVAIDVSDRAAQKADGQFYRAKSYPTFCPTGPAVVTPDALDAGALALTTHVNGALMQSGTTRDLIAGVEAIIEHVSAVAPLEVGDLILTGTPAGVGLFRKPPVFLRDGDRVRCAIEGIGAIDVRVEVID